MKYLKRGVLALLLLNVTTLYAIMAFSVGLRNEISLYGVLHSLTASWLWSWWRFVGVSPISGCLVALLLIASLFVWFKRPNILTGALLIVAGAFAGPVNWMTFRVLGW